MGKAFLITLVLFSIICTYSAFAMSPKITAYDIQSVPPNMTQISWAISDDDGLAKVELYEDTYLVYDKKISGLSQIDLYQVPDDGMKHTYTLVIYDIYNLTSIGKKEIRADLNPPVVNASPSVISKSHDFGFTTDEPAICKAGLDSNGVSDISSGNFTTEHNATFSFAEGLNRIFIKCADQAGNEMEGFYVSEYVYDTTPPSKVTNVTYVSVDGQKRLMWNDADDSGSGVDHYIIYNSLKSLYSVQNNFWDISTNDSIYYISAVDRVGNEGEKTEFNLKRVLLLNEEINASDIVEKQPVPMLVIGGNGNDSEKTGEKSNSAIPVIAWSAFGVLLVLFVAWKSVEGKLDKHGLNSYMNKRRKMREVRPRFKI